MLKRFKFLLLVLAPVFLLGLAAGPALVSADCAPTTTADAIQCGTDNAAGVPPGSNPTTINITIAHVIDLISVVVGIAAVVMIIIGGFRYITSGGNQESIKTAKNTILYALIGLIIVALAQVIVKFVLNKATNA